MYYECLADGMKPVAKGRSSRVAKLKRNEASRGGSDEMGKQHAKALSMALYLHANRTDTKVQGQHGYQGQLGYGIC